jgi:N-acetylneuraminic acid mutarotase
VTNGQTSNQWTWMSGADKGGQWGIYGTLGVPAAANVPGGREFAVSWIDGSGNLWLFGGAGLGSAGNGGYLNDLWEFNPTSQTWTWMSGSSTADATGVYGAQGVAAAANLPGARYGAVSWIDGSGNLWLFGGDGLDSVGATGYLNDLWEFNPKSKTWTWMSGSSTGGATGVYGTQGVPAAANVPGAKIWSVSWIDGSGNLWLFGGQGYDSAGNEGFLNDLWEFNPKGKTWTWMSGGDAGSQPGIYGTQGAPAAANVPGSRSSAVSWIDGSGNFWLFGGHGVDSNWNGGVLNDLWKFNPTSNMWTWVSGSSTEGARGVYGTQGVPAAANVPGARMWTVSWIDGSGNLWLFGGRILVSAGNVEWLNDLWEFNPTSKTWTWMSGSSTGGATGVYGTQGVPAAANVPGAREAAVSWIDGSGKLWLFGGNGYDSTGNLGLLNDLWCYQP